MTLWAGRLGDLNQRPCLVFRQGATFRPTGSEKRPIMIAAISTKASRKMS